MLRPVTRRSRGVRALGSSLRVAAIAAVTMGSSARAAEPAEAAEGEAGEAGEAGEGAEAGAGEVDATAATDAAPAASEAAGVPLVDVEPQSKRVRHDWYIGFGFGGGAGVDHSSADGVGVGLGGGGFIHAGGRVRERLAIGVRFVNGGAKTLGMSSALVEALFFPLPKRGLRIGGAVGPGAIWSLDQKSVPPGMRANTIAAGLGLEVGYDFWLLRRFNIGLDLFGNAAVGRGRQVAVMGLGLSFNWY